MKSFKVLKVLFLIGVVTLGFHGSNLLAGSCSATASNCGSTCSASSPNGNTVCVGSSITASCTAYDANGNVTSQTTARCRENPSEC